MPFIKPENIYKKIDFQLSTNELNIPQDALSFSVYDIEQEEYLFYEKVDSISFSNGLCAWIGWLQQQKHELHHQQ